MTPKEKAREIYEKMFSAHYKMDHYPTVACAVQAVELIITESIFNEMSESVKFWESVKAELKKI
ncbi:hypothetical protein FY557_17420 [Chryseobacterium sp. SN22]|uniref:hypothetical protein n=1 Tax=Chryseobacterium sp. SN22 TaxID=2606431 RepID=UPI0011EDD96B|nr:hypothetical protein [Chryseobacterium sp. SN22]KAA0126430.1 hypothetical protein FY557_17420 [Chryseobacterium sp. SN22]